MVVFEELEVQRTRLPAALGSAARLLQAPFVAPPLAKGETEGPEATSVV